MWLQQEVDTWLAPEVHVIVARKLPERLLEGDGLKPILIVLHHLQLKLSVHCPVCSKGFPEADINNHLDSCLGSSEATNDEMDDGDDDLLLAASIELENSINNDRAIEISDDDDEPLVKRSMNNRHYDSNSDDDDKFNDQTQQDDQDILAALGDTEDGTEADQSMFACPICDHLLSHGEMFSHLDQCTKNI